MNPKILIAVIAAAFLVVGSIEYRDEQQALRAAPLTHEETKLAEYYIKHHSPDPVQMARATAKTKRKRLMAAVAVTESNGNPRAVGKVGEVTAWQIREELHGPVGTTLEDHAKKAEEILEQMIRESDGNLRKGLSRYNGDRSGRYAAKVLARVEQVKL